MKSVINILQNVDCSWRCFQDKKLQNCKENWNSLSIFFAEEEHVQRHGHPNQKLLSHTWVFSSKTRENSSKLKTDVVWWKFQFDKDLRHTKLSSVFKTLSHKNPTKKFCHQWNCNRLILQDFFCPMANWEFFMESPPVERKKSWRKKYEKAGSPRHVRST